MGEVAMIFIEIQWQIINRQQSAITQRTVMKSTLKFLPPFIVILIGAIVLWSCSSSVDPQPETTVLSVDTTTGHTGVDTAILRDRMEKYLVQGRDDRDIPYMLHLVEVEELGYEAIATLLNTYDSGIEVLMDIADDERSQAEALRIMLDVLKIDHPNPEKVRGRFIDEEVLAVWVSYIAGGKHANAADALVAITKVFEFQLKQVIDARPQLHSRAASYAADVIYGMNSNHFRSMYRYLQSANVPYSPSFLTQDEFDEETSMSSYLQLG